MSSGMEYFSSDHLMQWSPNTGPIVLTKLIFDIAVRLTLYSKEHCQEKCTIIVSLSYGLCYDIIYKSWIL